MSTLLHIAFNQDITCIACGTDTGYCVYNCDPLKRIFDRKLASQKGMKIIELLFRCSIIALVGDGQDYKFPSNKVVLFNDATCKVVGELSFRSDIVAVRLRTDCIIIVLLTKIYVYQFNTLKFLACYQTIENPKGLCSVCPSALNEIFAFPGLQKGYVQVKFINDEKKSNLIEAHQSVLGCLTLTLDGCKLATASEKGTVIRIFDTQSGVKLQELQRGSNWTTIYSLAFHKNSTFLACSSEKGTIHIFRICFLNESENSSSSVHSTGIMSFLQSYIPKYKWLENQRSFAQFRIPSMFSIVAFPNEEQTIIIMCKDGNVLKVSFQEDMQDCVQQSLENVNDL